MHKATNRNGMSVERGGGGRGSTGTAADAMMSNSSKVMVVGGGPPGTGGYRWNGDAVPLKRRRVGLSNGGSISDAECSEEEQDEEDYEEGEAVGEELSYDGDGIGDAGEEEEEEEINEDDGDDDVRLVAGMDRGGSSDRGREPFGYDEHYMGTDDEGFDEEVAILDSPDGRYPVRDGAIEVSSPDDGRDIISDDSDDDKLPPPPVSRGMIDRGQSSMGELRREVIAVSDKAPKVVTKTAKRKAEVSIRNGVTPVAPVAPVAPKPKREGAPSTSKRKTNGDGGPSRERARFSTDNKARVTLERAREILAAVKAAMSKDPKQLLNRHVETHPNDNCSSSGDDRVVRKPPPPRATQQVRVEEKVAKKRVRPTKGDKEPTPRKRKPKVEIDHNGDDEKPFARRPQMEEPSYEFVCKQGHLASTSLEMDERDLYMKKESGDDGYEQKMTLEKKVRKRRKLKDTDDGNPGGSGLCPGSVLRNEDWEPPVSPFGLIQESLYKDPWKVLLSCMLLNKTAGRQMHKVIWDLFSLCPDAETAINMDTAKIAEKVYSLGLQNKRAKMIQRFSLEYLRGDWTNVTQLHGIGKYAADAYAIFCQGLWREVEPDDLQLAKYWKWLCETDGQGSGFKPEDQ